MWCLLRAAIAVFDDGTAAALFWRALWHATSLQRDDGERTARLKCKNDDLNEGMSKNRTVKVRLSSVRVLSVTPCTVIAPVRAARAQQCARQAGHVSKQGCLRERQRVMSC